MKKRKKIKTLSEKGFDTHTGNILQMATQNASFQKQIYWDLSRPLEMEKITYRLKPDKYSCLKRLHMPQFLLSWLPAHCMEMMPESGVLRAFIVSISLYSAALASHRPDTFTKFTGGGQHANLNDLSSAYKQYLIHSPPSLLFEPWTKLIHLRGEPAAITTGPYTSEIAAPLRGCPPWRGKSQDFDHCIFVGGETCPRDG